ncbi:type III-B CRISPR module RAMP protein Cmr6 [Paenibacillus faecalis]|uniref:type III-B CRISPR module RAMP protein Cmr6 n=1 Tax=Paenibacillus faecalis TaxID=2079532 RepID=UPI000D1068C5|nr:type III-B CRISPR module RAMP protein Cmr6 [Paenibacillus faecalis]
MKSNQGKNDTNKTYILPKDAAQFIQQAKLIDNDFLAFNRMVYKLENKKIELGPHQVPRSLRQSEKGRIHNEILSHLYYRMRKLAQSFPHTIQLQYTPVDKLLIGIGGHSPHSKFSSITLHALYGIPYIPSSALKGVVRNCWIQEKFEGQESKALKDATFRTCFGAGADEIESASRGSLIFFDSFPIKSYTITKDVQTPHYKKYYEQKGAVEPTDDQEPVPLLFPAVKGTTFNILIGVEKDFSKEQINLVQRMIKIALCEYGLGAKTAIGYGLGEVVANNY